MSLRPIDPTPFRARIGTVADPTAQAAPILQWIAIDKLFVDDAYQRGIAERGVANVRKIAIEFDWSKFAPVIVAAVEGGRFAIVDGQHRTTAAALCGVGEVPCQIIVADRARQADAFAAINGQVTAITPMQLHYARLVAGDAEAAELNRVCAQADVTICRYPVPAKLMKVGDTLAAGKLPQMLKRYGADVLVTALRCITRTRKGNAGMVRAPIIAALCTVFDAEPSFRADEANLLRAMQRFDFAAAFEAAAKRAYTERCGMASIITELVAGHLENNLASAA